MSTHKHGIGSRAQAIIDYLRGVQAECFERAEDPRFLPSARRIAQGMGESMELIIAGCLAQVATRHSCANCGCEFFSNAYQAMYCSPRCRITAQIRRARAKKAAAA